MEGSELVKILWFLWSLTESLITAKTAAAAAYIVESSLASKTKCEGNKAKSS